MSYLTHNVQMVEAAKAKIRAFDGLPGEPRFTIRFEGFGSGGTAGVTADGAFHYLDDLISERDMHYRFRTEIKSITVEVRVPSITISI